MEVERKHKKISRQMRLQKRKRNIFLLIAALAAAIVAAGGFYLMLKKYVSKVNPDIICDNIYIGAMEVSGFTEEQAAALLEEHLQADSGRVITMEVRNSQAQASLGEMGLYCKDLKKLVSQAVDYGKKGSIWERFRKIRGLKKEMLIIDEVFQLEEAAATFILNERAVPLEEGAVDAVITKTADGFSVTPDQEGKTIDIKKSIEKITDYLNGKWKHEDFSMKLISQKQSPRVKKEELQTIKDRLGTFSTDAGGGERWKNLKTGVEKLNGTILMPGDQVSVYETTSPYDDEHGYVPAGAYENGQVVDAYGGGICQVSTTLYNAILYAELEIVERYPHSMLVNYVKPSRDAAIAGDYLDLVFKNPYETPVYIEGIIDDNNQMIFTVYGKESRPANRRVEYESETLSTEDYGVTYKENPNLSLGEMSYVGSPHVGKEARLWKIVYEDEKEVSRDVFNNSSYSKSDEIVEVGTKTNNADAAGIVRSAIGTQESGKIQEAISKALSSE